jgi:prephenate dehydrogenase
VKPVELMKQYLPEYVEIIGTHPLFGPQSGKNGIEGLKIVVCPVRTTKSQELIEFLRNELKLEVLLRTPEEHDKEMAWVQALTHFVAKGLNNIGLADLEQKTKSYQHLLDANSMVKDDSEDLFMTMERENPFAKEIRDKFIDELLQIRDRIDADN